MNTTVMIPPRISFWLTIVIAVATLLASGSGIFPTTIPAKYVTGFQEWDMFLLKIWSVIAPILHISGDQK